MPMVCIFLFLLIMPTLGSGEVINDDFMNRLAELEGFNSLSVDGDDVTEVVRDIVLNDGKSPNFSELFKLSKEASNQDVADTLFVLSLFSAAVEGNSSQAIIELKNRPFKKTYVDDLGEETTSKELLHQSYAWLINNTSMSVPGVLVERMPGLVDDHTPFWGSTRDKYFRIQRPDGWRFFNSSENRAWRSLLNDIEIPSRDVMWLGTIRNSKLKSSEIYNGLVTLNPQYFLSKHSKFIGYGKSPKSTWIECWAYQGPYEFFKVRDYAAAKNDAINALVKDLLEHTDLSDVESVNLSRIYIQKVEESFVYNDKLVEICDESRKLILEGDWKKAIELTSVDPYYESNILKVIGGLLSEYNPDALPEFIKEVQLGDKHREVVSEVISLDIIRNANYTLLKNIKIPDVWGDFNKTPLMYVAQFNVRDSIRPLIEALPGLVEATTTSGPSNPVISKRTAVMYAMQYGDLKTIDALLDLLLRSDLNVKDSEGRNIFYYLAMNSRLSKDNRFRVISRLKKFDIQTVSPSFDCWESRSRVEFLTCGSQRYAELDVELSTEFSDALKRATSKHAKNLLRSDQISWLEERSDIFDDEEQSEIFEIKYKKRIEFLRGFNDRSCGASVFVSYFPCKNNWSLESFRFFKDYAVGESLDGEKYISTPIRGTKLHLNVVSKGGWSSYVSILGIPVSIYIDGIKYSESLDRNGLEALKNASNIEVLIFGESFSVSAKGSGASVIWLTAS